MKCYLWLYIQNVGINRVVIEENHEAPSHHYWIQMMKGLSSGTILRSVSNLKRKDGVKDHKGRAQAK